MKWLRTDRSRRDYQRAPLLVQRAFDKQVRLLAENLNHPSLHAKKYNEAHDVWQARVNRNWRLYFTIQGDVYSILAVIPHPK